VTATFTEEMRAASVSAATVKLVKAGETVAVPAAVTYNPATNKATLNPSASLAKGTNYTATVSTGVKDLAGNALDQNPTLEDDQPKTWSFTTAP
jgi:Big-like domain-containing protein